MLSPDALEETVLFGLKDGSMAQASEGLSLIKISRATLDSRNEWRPIPKLLSDPANEVIVAHPCDHPSESPFLRVHYS